EPCGIREALEGRLPHDQVGFTPRSGGKLRAVANGAPLTDGAALPQYDPPPESGAATPRGYDVSFPGPFSHHKVVVEGWAVPLLHAHPCGPHDDRVMLVVDERIAITLSVQEAERF